MGGSSAYNYLTAAPLGARITYTLRAVPTLFGVPYLSPLVRTPIADQSATLPAMVPPVEEVKLAAAYSAVL